MTPEAQHSRVSKRPWLGVSLAFNLVLLLVAALIVPRPSPNGDGESSHDSEPEKASRGSRQPARRASPPRATSPELASLMEPVTWTSLEHEEIATVASRLRAVGCPDRTIREILTSRVNHTFALNRRVVADSLNSSFWELCSRGTEELGKTFGKELTTAREDLEKGMAEIGRALGEPPAPTPDEQLADHRRGVSFLPEDKQARVAEIKLLFDGMRTAINDSPYDPAALRLSEVDKREREALSEALTPDEWLEYRLRTEGHASWATDLHGFEPTEEELRNVAARTMELKDRQQELEAQGLGEAEAKARAIALNEDFQKELKVMLGAERYAEYQRASDGDFQQVHSITSRYELSEEVAVKAFEQRQEAIDRATRIQNDPAVTPESRAQMLDALKRQAEQSLREALGEAAYTTYEASLRGADSSWAAAFPSPSGAP